MNQSRDEALAELLRDLEEGGGPSPEWLAAHASGDDADGALAKLWAATEDVEVMVRLALRSVPRPLVVEVVSACARLVLPLLPADDVRPRLAVEAAEAWARGELSWEEAETAADEALAVVFAVNAAAREAAQRAARAAGEDEAAAEAAAREATTPESRPLAYDAAFAAADAAFAAAETDDQAADPAAYAAAYAASALARVRPGGRREVADLLRRSLPAPSLATLGVA